MKPVSPVIPRTALDEIIFAEDQAEYLNLPAIKNSSPEGMVTTRWHLTWQERFRVLFSGNLWLSILTFHNPLQPITLTTKCPKTDAK